MSGAFIFDLETTSADSKTTSPCQICLIYTDGEQNRILLNTLVRPNEPIGEGATGVHGISNEMVTNAVDTPMIAWQCNLLNATLTPTYLIGFNSKYFDEPIIDRCLGGPVFENTTHIDVLDVAYRFFPEAQSHKLGMLYETFTGKSLEGAHDAAVDVLGTLELLTALRTKIGMTIEQLADEMKEAKPYPVLPIGKYKGALLDQIPKSWARWMAANASDMRGDLQATVDYVLSH